MNLDSLFVCVVYLCIPWVCLEVVSQFFLTGSGRSINILGGRRQRRSSLGLLQVSSSSTRVSRGPLWIKIETTRLNELPKRLLYLLERFSARRRASRRRRGGVLDDDDDTATTRGVGDYLGKGGSLSSLARRSYDYGSIFAGLALLGSIAFLLWGAFDLISKIVELQDVPSTTIPPHQEIVSSVLQKRSGSDPIGQKGTGGNASRMPTLVPLIPGVTIPFSHLWPLLLALSFTQIIHEAGHAICAAMHSWTPLDTGLILIFPCIPGAFVNLPREALEEGEEGMSSDARSSKQAGFSTSRLQIVSAGVWHNALSALFVALILYSGISSTAHHVYWKSVDGLQVEGVQGSSPLFQHLPPGTTISRIDDLDLETTTMTSTESAALWREYLTGDYDKQDQGRSFLGWCISRETWNQEQTTCCDSLDAPSSTAATTNTDSSSSTSGICFQTLHDEEGNGGQSSSPGRCFDPVRLVSGKQEMRRCSASCLSPEEVCIVADPREQLIRISVQQDKNVKKTRVVLFQGSPQAIYSAVTLAEYRSRIPWFPLPYSWFEWWNLFVSYFLNLSVAMALLNMLPLPTLDGDVYSSFILQALVGHFHQLEDDNIPLDGAANHNEPSPDDIELGAGDEPHSSDFRSSSWRTSHGRYSADDYPGRRQGKLLHQHKQRHRLLNASLLARIHSRFRWFTVLLAIFVFGGSIFLHATGDGAEVGL